MPSLKELQISFSDAVYDNKYNSLSELIKGREINNSSRIKIYQDNVLITLYNTLKNCFPSVCNLVDEQFFKYAVNEYIKVNKPKSGNLDDYGDNFADFLANMKELKDFPYIEDVAKLEWALHSSYFAADVEPIDRVGVSQIEPERLESIKFDLHPSAQLISSKYPINKIWQVSQQGYEGDFNLDINSGGVDILVVRPEYKINTIILEMGEYPFLNSLLDGSSLGDAFEFAYNANEEFDIGIALQKFIMNGTFVRFYF